MGLTGRPCRGLPPGNLLLETQPGQYHFGPAVLFLPIVEREMREAVRRPRAWWRRVGSAAVALVIACFVFLTVSNRATTSYMGQQLFSTLAILGMIYGLLSGPLSTVDCLSRERRDGTLGLLFLTDLRSHDVVLGKMASASLHVVLDMTAALPLAAIPVLLGGVSLTQSAMVALAMLNLMFFSLATGVWASSLFSSGRSALAATLLLLLFLSVGLPVIGEEILKVSVSGRKAAWLYMVCPLYTIATCVGSSPARGAWNFWINLGGTHVLSWVFLAAAAFRTHKGWRDLPACGFEFRWQSLLARWGKGSERARRSWRRRMLDRNPISWLEGRQRLQQKVLWAVLLATSAFWMAKYLHAPRSWPSNDLVILWPMFAHYILCVWIAIEAPRRLADDKHSGALELLLCAPLPPAEIVRGAMRMLWRHFGRLLVVLMAFNTFTVLAYTNAHGLSGSQFLFTLGAWSLVVLPLQTYSLARVGIYQALVQANSLRATFMVAWKIGLVPWIVFVASVLLLEFARRHSLLPSGFFTNELVIHLWAVVHILVCAGFLAHASLRLGTRFRFLAAQPSGQPWWKRWNRSNA
jgi:ABC-type transport system involved in cytochrome c biogenesis permease component